MYFNYKNYYKKIFINILYRYFSWTKIIKIIWKNTKNINQNM